jgi:xanthine dehydrogenase accessory factor
MSDRMRTDLLLLAADLARRGEPFALVTVVRREAPSSVRVGDAAIVTRAGEIRGWIGGSCTQTTVMREALQALEEGAPRVIALAPDAPAEGNGRGVFPMTCLSGGSVELIIEPQLPPARLVVLGLSPVALALARLGKAMGYVVEAVDPDADGSAFPEADRVLTDPAALSAGSGTPPFAVVATMGQWDEEAILAALALEPAYLGLVASRTRAERLREALKARGVTGAALDRIRCPAGLDLGARSPEEIALSVLAEIVQSRHAEGAAAPEAPLAGSAASGKGTGDAAGAWALDPVCGMRVPTSTAHRARLGDRSYHFCCAGCRERFLAEPERYRTAVGATGAPGAIRATGSTRTT